MTDIDIQIAIAEACGWTQIKNHHTMAVDGIWRGYPPQGQLVGRPELLPNYPTDLNAMHEAEKELIKRELWEQYFKRLLEKVCADYDEPLNYDTDTLWHVYSATARQRAEAFLQTIGKWKE